MSANEPEKVPNIQVPAQVPDFSVIMDHLNPSTSNNKN